MTIYFPDVYSGQAGISFKDALAVLVKATEGTGYVNPDYAAAKDRAAGSGTFFGAYHFLLAGNAAAQAQHAFSTAGPHVPLMLDFEIEDRSHPSLSDAASFIDEYRRLGGMLHLLYFPRWYWEQLGSPDLGIMRSFGMALVSSDYTAYTDADSGAGWQPYGGMTPAVWQYTSSLKFNGFSCDFNAFRGSYAGRQDPASVAATLEEFRSLATTGGYQQPGTWTYGPPRNLLVRPGRHNFHAEWASPAGAPEIPAAYMLWVYRGDVCDHDTLVDTYPRTERFTQTLPDPGGLDPSTLYTLHVAAMGPSGTHMRPGVYASAQFTTAPQVL